ncbi:MAG: hypothetical protein QM605_13400 [Sphingobium sp.]
MAWNEELYDLQREASALEKQINQGIYTHPMEIWEMCQRLIEAEKHMWAQQLAKYLPDEE